MNARRVFLYLALGLILILIWTSWQSEHAAKPPPEGSPAPAAATQSTPVAKAASAASVPAHAAKPAPVAGLGEKSARPARPDRLEAPSGPMIAIRTDVLDAKLALKGATLSRLRLLAYAKNLGSKARVSLLDPRGQDFLTTSLVLISPSLPAALEYQAGQAAYQLAPNAQTLVVPLSWSGGGVEITRRFVFTRASYEVHVRTTIHNASGAPIRIRPGVRILGHNPPTPEHFWQRFLPQHWTYRGPSYYHTEYNKLEASSLKDDPFAKTFSHGWIASVNQYFVTAAIPDAGLKAHYYGRAVGNAGYAIGYVLPPVTVAGGRTRTLHMKYYLGPKLQGQLDAVAPGLSRTVDYGLATIISHPLFMILGFIHDMLGNWGWSLIILVLLIKAVFYFPQRMSARSMAKMRKLQPRLKLLKERYKDDRKKLSEATMKLYREEGANPVTGCLPMLIQVPIFFGLFYVLIYSVELRHAPWVLWIKDLSAPDPFYILPILFAVAMLVQFRLQPQSVDNAQAKIMMIMPLGMAFLYAIFPSGLVLYYLLNTLLNIAIQWQVNRELGIPLDLLPKSWMNKLKGA